MNSMTAPLGEVAVDVTADIDKLLANFKNAEAASDRFDRALSQKVGKSADNAKRATDALAGAEARLMRQFDQAGQAAGRYAQQMNKAQAETVAVARSTDTAMASIRRSLLASAGIITAALGVNQIKNMADSYTRLTNQMKLAGLEGAALGKQQEAIFQIAQKYGVEMEGLGALFGRVTQAQNELGISTAEVNRIVTGTAAAVRIYGAGQNETRGAIIQLTQALGGEIVRAEEFNSINEGLRPVLQAVASQMEKYRGSVAALRRDVIEGKVASADFAKALSAALPALEAQAQRANLTIGQAFTTLNNALGRYIGQTDQALSASARVGAGIAALANNLDTIMPILTALILAIGTKYVVAAGASVAASIRDAAAKSRAALAANALATANARLAAGGGAMTASMTTAAASVTRLSVIMATTTGIAGRLGAGLLAAFGGWVGVAIMAVAGAVYYFYQKSQEAEAQVVSFNQHQKNAADLLDSTRNYAKRAGDEIKNVGTSARGAATDMRAFAGATGEAAAQLRQLAVERRKERMDAFQKARDDLEADRIAARKRMNDRKWEYQPGPQRNLKALQEADAADAAVIANADRMIAELDRRWGQIRAQPLENEVPLAKTGGRDIPAEIEDFQRQLVAATTARNETAQRHLLAEIKLRQRIVALMKDGLSLEVAQATAQAEKIKAPSSSTAAPKFTSQQQAIGVAIKELESLGLSLAGNTKAKGGWTGGHANNADHNRNAVDVNIGAGVIEANDPAARAKFDALALQYQKRGFRILWNGRIYEPGGDGPGGAIKGKDQHRDHMDIRAPENIVGRSMGTDSLAEAEAAMEKAAAAAVEERARNAERFAADLQRTQDDILQAQQDQLVDEAEIFAMAQRRVNLERDREKDSIEARRLRGELLDNEARDLTTANENLRTEQLRGLDLKERQRLEQNALRRVQTVSERQIEALEAERDLALTAVERRNVDRRILAAQKELERLTLEAIVKSPYSSPLDKELAQGDLNSLDRRYGQRGASLDRANRDDLLGSAPGGSESAHIQDLNRISEQEAERLAIVEEALAARLILEEEAARRRVEIERDAQQQIRELELQRQLVSVQAAQSTAESLASIAESLGGRQSAAYRALFAMSKAFAIAQSVMQIQVAIANALALPFPANLPAIAQVAALGAGIVQNIMSIGAQFDVGGWTGNGPRNRAAGTVHGQEFVVRAGPAARYRPELEAINAGRNPTMGLRSAGAASGGLSGASGAGGLKVALHNHAPGVEHEARQISPGEIEIIARKVVREDAPGVVASDMARPNSKTSKAIQRNTTARPRRK